MVPHMVHLQDVVKLHTFVLGHLGALLLACFGFDLRFALVAFDLVSDSIWCEGVGVGVGARGGSTWAGGDYLRGALGWERRANLRTTNKARSHTHTQAQATQPLHRGPPTPIPTAIQQSSPPLSCGSGRRTPSRGHGPHCDPTDRVRRHAAGMLRSRACGPARGRHRTWSGRCQRRRPRLPRWPPRAPRSPPWRLRRLDTSAHSAPSTRSRHSGVDQSGKM